MSGFSDGVWGGGGKGREGTEVGLLLLERGDVWNPRRLMVFSGKILRDRNGSKTSRKEKMNGS